MVIKLCSTIVRLNRPIGLILCGLDLSGRGHFRHVLVQGHLCLLFCTHTCGYCVPKYKNRDVVSSAFITL